MQSLEQVQIITGDQKPEGLYFLPKLDSEKLPADKGFKELSSQYSRMPAWDIIES